jgi:hypothetical protein
MSGYRTQTKLRPYISCNNGVWLQEFNIDIAFVVVCVKGFIIEIRIAF